MSHNDRLTEYKGQTMSISGDTDFSENIIKLGDQADLMILEC
jgi:ribonuclease BN (tRNA processing enzyme)|tara:strand:+ start:562 stop:687 length:126 start_codon:yes stop_codon:yes gene_type:complete